MATNQKQNDEEVDLGSLFLIIGKGFKNFFNFIGSIFKGLFHLIILFLIFVKQHFLKFLISGILGGVVGGFFHFKGEDVYFSKMLVQPNHDSSKQLYSAINTYADLVKQKDYTSLSKIFNLSEEQAMSLKNIYIEPIERVNDIVEGYDQLIESKDSITISSFTYEIYKSSFTKHDYKLHEITVKSIDKEIFSNLETTLLSSLNNNTFLTKVLAANNESFKRTDSIFRRNLFQMDSLSKVYMQVMLDEAKKDYSGTSIDMGSNKKASKELDLFVTKRDINDELNTIVTEYTDKSQIVNVISSFQPIGEKVSGIENNLVFIGFSIAIGLMLFYLSIIKLIRYLDSYQN